MLAFVFFLPSVAHQKFTERQELCNYDHYFETAVKLLNNKGLCNYEPQGYAKVQVSEPLFCVHSLEFYKTDCEAHSGINGFI